jgi:hypothetical protein
MNCFAPKDHITPQKKVVPLPPRNPCLTLEQHKVIQLLLVGYSANEAASLVGKSRDTVSRWKNENPIFIAEMNKQRDEILKAGYSRLQNMMSKAIDVLENHLGKGNLKAATDLLKIIATRNPMPEADSETDPEKIIQRTAEKIARDELGGDCPEMGKLTADIAELLRTRYGVRSALIDLLEGEDDDDK